MSTDDARSPDLFDGLIVLVRRWYVVLPVLLVTGLLAFQAHNDTAASYRQSLTLGLVTPSVVTTPRQNDNGRSTVTSNPLASNGDTTLLANLVLVSLGRPAVTDAVTSAGRSARLNVSIPLRTTAIAQLPAITLTVAASTPEEAQAGLDAARELAVQNVATVQTDAGVPEERLATAYVLSSQDDATATVPSTVRATVSVGLTGVIVAVVLAAVTDAVARRFRGRGRRRPSRQSAGES